MKITKNQPVSLTTIALVLALVVTAPCQEGMGSHAPPPSAGVPLLPADGIPVTPADVVSFPPASCVPLVLYRGADLGLPPGGNVDGISHALRQDNDIPELGPALGGLLATGQSCDSRFSVDPTSSGALGFPPGVVATEALTDGAACDVFRVAPFGVIGNATLVTDAECINPAPNQTDIDAITAATTQPVYPIFYSVDAATAAAMTPLQVADPISLAPAGPAVPVHQADILVAVAPGVALIAFRWTVTGLASDDDIDGLSIGEDPFTGAPVVLCTLRAGSTTANIAWPGFGPLGGAGVFTLSLFPGMPLPWATPLQMGLSPTDEMNALIVGDPGSSCGPPSHPGTGDDLLMLTGINGPVDACDTKTAGAWDVLDLFFHSPGGTLDWQPVLVVGQLFTPGQTPTNNIPGVHLSPFGAPPIILVDGLNPTVPFGSPPVLPGGNFHSFQIQPDPTIQGLHLMIQTVVLSPLAANGFLAASDGHVLQFP